MKFTGTQASCGDSVFSAVKSAQSLPQLLDVQTKAWQDRIAAERLRILEYFHRLARTVHIGAFVYRVNQLTKPCVVVEIFLHLFKEI